jgi:hypothetical protein
MINRIIIAALLALASLGAIAQPTRSQGTITTQNLVAAGVCTTGGCVEIDVANRGAVTVQVTGTYTGALSGQATTDGVTWVTLAASGSFTNVASGATSATITSASTGLYRVSGVVGALRFRIAGLAAMTGTATITLQTAPVPPESSTTISGGAGDASAANQVTGNASLASIDGKLSALGTQAIAASVSVTPATSSTWAATQSGTWNARVQDGSGNAITSAARGAERAVSVQIVDGSGNQVTTFGGSGGTASTVGSATPATATAIGGNDGTNMQVPRVADLDTGAGSQYALITSMRLGASGGGVELVGGAGAVSAGVLRTTQASDSPMVTNTGAQADSVCGTDTGTCSLIALIKKVNSNLTASNTQLPADGTGQVTMANSFPVTIASDQTSFPVTIAAGSATIGALTANQSVNVAQINGVTPLMGAGNTGTGSPRVTLATDQAAIATHGHGATGAAVPANAQLAGFRSGANMVAAPMPSATVPVAMSTATTTQHVALSGSTLIYVTSVSLIANGTTNATFVYGTGTNCGTGTTSLTGAYKLTAQVGLTMAGGMPVFVVPAGQALCVTNSAAVAIDGHITYTQY